MKERPILFSAPMVRAILAGTKTQTRRVVKRVSSDGQAVYDDPCWIVRPTNTPRFNGHSHDFWLPNATTPYTAFPRCPYGPPGDRMWVRENGWERPERTPKMMREGADTWAPYYYDADGISDADAEDFKTWGFKRRPSIHMPRWASRITLEVTGVRVDRLQDISEADALAEGIHGATEWDDEGPTHGYHWDHQSPTDYVFPSRCGAYRALWESINGPGSWDTNPWVWVVEFRRIT